MELAGKSENDKTNQCCSTHVDNNREHESLSNCQDTNSVREVVAEDPKTIVEENPPPNKRLRFPPAESHLNWQHIPSKHHIPEPVMSTPSVDHVCELCSNPSNPLNSDDGSPSSAIDSSLFPTANAISGMPVKVSEDPNQLDEVPSPASKNCLPQKVVLTLNADSPPTTMDFHPIWNFILLVGTEIGRIKICAVAPASWRELVSVNFEVWEERSTKFKAAIGKDMWISVNKVIWSSHGMMFGVAFAKHLVQLYFIGSSNSPNGERTIGVCRHLEIEAHDGSVNDIALYLVRGQPLVITCGDDKAVKIWDANNGEKLNTLLAHNAPVCSICTHAKENVLVIISTSIDGKIKARLYNRNSKGADYDTIGCGYTKFAYSTDDQRLFSCGFIKEGEPFLVEWDDSSGNKKRVYKGLKAPTPSSSKIQFDTTLNRFLAAGDDHMVKYWDMDNVQLLDSTNADGELLANPCLCFSKDGRLLAVAARENKIKILAPDCDDIWKIFKVAGSQCQFLQLPVYRSVNKIVRLIYTKAGKGILVLTSDGINILWKWPGNEQATSHDCPRLWKPGNGLQFMINDRENVRLAESVGCFAISNNGVNLISTSGGPFSLFNMETFETIKTFMSPPSEATSISFYPRDDNVVAVGFVDSSILIYNIHTDRLLKKLAGNSTIVTSVAFSNPLHVLVHAEADNTIFSWNVERWENVKGRRLQMPAERDPEVLCDTHIKFHPEEINFLAVQHSHLAIYEAQDFTFVSQWVQVPSLPILQADFSSDGTEIYAGLGDGTIHILDASNLQPLCRVDPTAYLPLLPNSSSEGLRAIAANPVKAGQFAVGFSDGKVYVMEPPEGGLKWSTLKRDG